MSNPNPRKRAAPGSAPMMPAQQQRMPQSYAAPSAAGDQMVKWNGGGVDNYGGLGGNSYDLIQSQPQYSQNGATPSNSLTRRPMNQALVATHPLSGFDGSMPWNDLNEDTSLVGHGQDGDSSGQDNVELLEEMAQKAKRDAQGKRKQIPPFVQKLSSFLEEGKNEDLIRWSEKGDSFIVLDEDEFAKTLIPELFKHRNYASFVRQLNMYGFHKRVGLSDNSMRASERKNKIPSEYSNPYFRRGHPNLLWLISKPKSGTKGKKNSKNDGEGESDEDAGLEDASGQVPSSSSAQATKTLPSTENSAVARKEMNVLREELLQVREQQKIIGGTIRRLQQSNNDLYNQAMLFQNQHDRHQNSINAILNFLANLFRKSLEEQGNAQSVSDIISSMIANQGQAGAHQGNVVDLGDFFQTSVDGGSSLGGPPAKRARGLLPPIPAQNTSARSTRSPSSGRGSFAPPTNHSNQEMGHITELTDGSPADTPPNIRQELETNPQEQMMRIINDHNATNTSGMDLPEAAEFVASAPNLNQDQRNKLANFMARQSNSPSSTGPNFASPSSSRPPAAYNQQAPPQPRPAQQAQPQATPYTGDTAAAPSLSPIMKSPAMDPLSMHQINSNQNELDQLHQLQNQQDQKLSELQSMLGPLSPSGRIPEIDETGGEQYFDPNNVDFDQFFDFNNIDDATFGGVPNDFNVDFSTAGHNNGLNTGQAGMHGGNNNGNTNTPSPAGTEEITRDELGISGGADGGNKRRRVS